MAHVTALGEGAYRVEVDGRLETVYVAGPVHDRWVFWNGHVYRVDARPEREAARRSDRSGSRRTLTAPMPASVIAVHVQPGDTIRKGQTLMLLEAMKMELPIRAPQDAVIAAVNCQPGDLVQGDAVLVEFQ